MLVSFKNKLFALAVLMAAISTDAQTICNMLAAGLTACKPVWDTSKPNPADCNVLLGSLACRYAI
ncbi:hypothetical protein Pint_14365 [Pistacia integerrima]|uniref:Uncharacterized protein n=1 Tax=Pistacia integerrima TaxID=434235 RepID=A0ACC0Y6L2_9ROSI|nr:hypothetical protein Pint_14365 [Pistacia integerrima]